MAEERGFSNAPPAIQQQQLATALPMQQLL
jgi:hypothetical protein